MRRVGHLALACVASLALYVALNALVLNRPITHGALATAVQAGLDRAAAIPRPRLVILAGSNAPFSHRCAVLEAALALPCVNAGVAVGIGLDYLFARWDPLLRPGDTVYLPMEPGQYIRSRLATATGPDAAIMARQDRATLAAMRPERWAGAALAADLRGVMMAAVEMILARTNTMRPDEPVNAWGDRTGHAAERAALPMLLALPARQPDAAAIAGGHGTALIGAFTRRMAERGVRVIGGLSTGFDDAPLTDAALAAISAAYTGNGGHFLALPTRSHYPRAYFFDGPEHLSEPYQIQHSRLLAAALEPLLRLETVRDMARAGME